MKLHLDSDGVFASFDEHVFNLFGQYPQEMNDAEMWRRANAHPAFWSDMPLMDGARDLWEVTRHLNPTILTGCPKSDFDRAAAAKKAWWKKHFNHDNVITCLSRDKALHMNAPGDVLLDDMKKNLKRWESAGGIGVFHKNNEQSIAELKRIGVI